jgi:hypothetical protein
MAAQSGRLSSLRSSLFLSSHLSRTQSSYRICTHTRARSRLRCPDEGVGGGDRRAFNIARVENYDPTAFTLVFEVRSPVFRLIYRRRWSTVHDFPKGLSITTSTTAVHYTTTILPARIRTASPFSHIYIYIYTLERFLINS